MEVVSTMQNIRIAAVTCRSPVGEIDHNLTQTVHWTQQAKAAGADLVCFPELNISGYCNQPEIASIAQSIPGPTTQRLSALAVETHMIILAGLAENNPNGPPFASHCVFWPDAKLAVYRKVHLSPPEKAFFQAGDEVPIFKTPKATFGIQLCYDGHFPELATAMTSKGADIIFIPHASPRTDAATKHQSWLRHLPARAYDNSVFIVACNQWGDNGKGLQFPGNAVVLDPSGTVLEKSIVGREELLVANLKADALKAVRNHPMRHFFPNRRPEIY